MASFFEHQEAYDKKADETLRQAAIDATRRPWTPFYLVGVALFDGSVLVLGVHGIGLA